MKTIASEVFLNSKIKRITIPKNVTKIEHSTFHDCKNLKQIMFEEGSKLEKIGFNCFRNSGLEEITLPKALKKVGYGAFENCGNLKTIYVEDGCEADLLLAEVPNSTKVGPLPETMAGGVRVWGLRE